MVQIIQKETQAVITQQHYEIVRLREALGRIVQWSDAYPVPAFRELTGAEWAAASAALKQCGMTLDRVSASNMRHAISGAGDIAKAALAEEEATP